jgi:putative cell wall-binding protein/uncharacterized protein YkwD
MERSKRHLWALGKTLLAAFLVVSLFGAPLAFAAEEPTQAISSTTESFITEAAADPSAATPSMFDSLAAEFLATESSTGMESLALSPTATPWSRLSGTDRYDTMAAIANMSHDQSDVVILASGNDFPDALAASSVAGLSQAPLLLTDSKSLSSQAAEKIISLSAKQVIIVGGTGSVSSAIENQLRTQLGADAVSRLSGANRYQTAYALYDNNRDAWSDTAIIASGNTFADALSIAPYAYQTKAPIFLYDATAGSMDSASANALKTFDKIILVGGPGSLPDSIVTQLGFTSDSSEGNSYLRLSGDDRYQTSAVVAYYGASAGVLSFENMALATGKDFPDALSGGTFCGSISSVLLLVDNEREGRYGLYALVAPSVQLGYTTNGYLLGGPGTISISLAISLNNMGQTKWEEEEVVRLVNVERAKLGLPALVIEPYLQVATDIRSEEIVSLFEHTRPHGEEWSTVFDDILLDLAAGGYRVGGENIARGYATPALVVEAWMNSPGHRANILDPDFTEIGVGYCVAGGQAHWAQLFLG